MALEQVTQRMYRITSAFEKHGVPYALIGGQAVAIWVSSKDPGSVRTTKDVDILLSRRDLERAKQAAATVDMDYFVVSEIGMFLERENPSPKHGVHIIWADEQIRMGDAVSAPPLTEAVKADVGMAVISIQGLVTMKLLAYRDHDRTHLRDMIGVCLVTRELLPMLPPQLAPRLKTLLDEMGVA